MISWRCWLPGFCASIRRLSNITSSLILVMFNTYVFLVLSLILLRLEMIAADFEGMSSTVLTVGLSGGLFIFLRTKRINSGALCYHRIIFYVSIFTGISAFVDRPLNR